MSASLVLAAVVGALVGGLLVALLLSRRQSALVADAARLETALDAAERRAAAERDHAAATETTLRETFTSLSRDALRENREDFLLNAGALLDPVRATLDKVQSQLVAVDRAREGSHQALVTQLRSLAGAQEQLRSAAEGLTRSLKSPNARGRWGEVQLRRVVELAGMVEHCDFVEKLSTTDEQGARLTPDLIVKLPGDTNIVVDAKVPIDAYLAASTAGDESARQDRLGAHVRQVRDHIRTLGAKEYWRQFQPAPEFVVMFLPLEPLLSTAFEQDATLFEQAASLRVIPATPMTLLALLKAVSYGWKQQQLARNAEEIQQIGRDLYERLATLTEHLEGVGKNIKGAADSYDRFIGSLETKVVPAARRFRDLGVSATKEVALPDPLTLSVRRVKKDDLIVMATDDEADPGDPDDLSRH
jgi:DNA recombination protein RmuC